MNTVNFKTWLENRTAEVCVLCPNQNQVNELMQIALDLGFEWLDEDAINLGYYWNDYEEETCYFFSPDVKRIEFCDVGYARANGYVIYTMDDFNIPVSKQTQLINKLKQEYPKLNYKQTKNTIEISQNDSVLIVLNTENKTITNSININQNLLQVITRIFTEMYTDGYHIRLIIADTYKNDYPYLVKTEEGFELVASDLIDDYTLQSITFTKEEFEHVKSNNKMFADSLLLVGRD